VCHALLLLAASVSLAGGRWREVKRWREITGVKWGEIKYKVVGCGVCMQHAASMRLTAVQSDASSWGIVCSK